MRENTNQENPGYVHFSSSALHRDLRFLFEKVVFKQKLGKNKKFCYLEN